MKQGFKHDEKCSNAEEPNCNCACHGVLHGTKINHIKHKNQHDIFESGFLNIKDLNVNIAKQHSENEFKKHNKNLNILIPNFNKNYLALQQSINKNSLNIEREKMPVIEPEDIIKFDEDLKNGRIDIFKPYAREYIDKMMQYPEFFKSKRERDFWLQAGLKDNDLFDDIIPVITIKFPAKDLKPLQSQIWLDLITKKLIQHGIPTQTSRLINTSIITSKDGYILDGHHRWSQVMLTNPKLEMKVLYMPFTVEDLLLITKSYSIAIERKTKK